MTARTGRLLLLHTHKTKPRQNTKETEIAFNTSGDERKAVVEDEARGTKGRDCVYQEENR
jgi:hypothetical protein